MSKTKASLYRFDGRIFEVCFDSSDGPTVTDMVIGNCMSEAVEAIELISSGIIHSVKEVKFQGSIRFTSEKSRIFMDAKPR